MYTRLKNNDNITQKIRLDVDEEWRIKENDKGRKIMMQISSKTEIF